MNLRFVCAQPATLYYAWQVEVMLNNFIKNGINPNYIDIVCYKPDGIVSDKWTKLAENYPARFFFYNDTRINKHYISSILFLISAILFIASANSAFVLIMPTRL